MRTHTNAHRRMYREVELTDVPETLNCSAVSPSHKESCGCTAMPFVIFYTKLTGLWHLMKTKPFQISFVCFLAPSIFLPPTKSQSQHQCGVPSLVSPWSRLRWPSAALQRLPTSWLARPLIWQLGQAASSRRAGRQLECLSE